MPVAPLEESDLPANRFRRSQRLLKSSEFQAVYRQGQTIVTPTLIFRVLPNELEVSRLGLTVSRKVGKAVVRNLIKRRIREVFRQKQGSFHGTFDIVVSPRRGILEKSFDDYVRGFDILLRKVRKLSFVDQDSPRK